MRLGRGRRVARADLSAWSARDNNMRVLLALLGVCVLAAAAHCGRFDHVTVERTEEGRVHAVYGPLGRLADKGRCRDGCSGVVGRLATLLEVSGREEFEFVREEDDPAGHLHYRLQQRMHGMEVDGGEAIVHHNPRTDAVYAVSSSIARHSEEAGKAVAAGVSPHVLQRHGALVEAELRAPEAITEPEPVLLFHEGELTFAVRVRVRFTAADGSERLADVYLHAVTGRIVFTNHLSCDMLDRSIYTADYGDDIPGELIRTEGQPPTDDPAANGAYNNAGYCYNFYYDKFRRDSFDGKGSEMISTVHYMKDYNNAFWNGEQMVYGDGDGVNLANFSQSLQVVCHELTHAVVQYTAGLRYWRDSGALNEAWADAMGNSAVIYHQDGLRDHIWEIGKGVILQGNGRIMNNPSLDGHSSDFYPDRYMGYADNGGVHGNSGIGNLAFALLTTGGVHPTQKTKNWVNGIGIYKAEQVWYYGLKNYMMRTTNYLGARVATVLAASDLFEEDDVNVVESAWAAVGLGDAPAYPYPVIPPTPPAPAPSAA